MNKNRIRYRQRDFHLTEIEDQQLDWSLEKYGCGPTSIANILINYGYSFNPVDIAKKILFDKEGNFDPTYLRNKGIHPEGLIYCLDRLIAEDKLNVSYWIIHIDFSYPDKQKDQIMKWLKEGYMAIIHVGPSEGSPLTFSKHGHYLVVSDVDDEGNLYVINSNEIGDNQLGVPFNYSLVIDNMRGRKDSFQFLFIKNK